MPSMTQDTPVFSSAYPLTPAVATLQASQRSDAQPNQRQACAPLIPLPHQSIQSQPRFRTQADQSQRVNLHTASTLPTKLGCVASQYTHTNYKLTVSQVRRYATGAVSLSLEFQRAYHCEPGVA